MARKTKHDTEQTREDIFTSALEILYKKGYARTTFVDIAKHIKLTKGAVYWHFPTKPDLFLALGKRMEKRIESILKGELDTVRTLQDLQKALYNIIMCIVEDKKLCKYYTTVFYRMEWTDELLPLQQYLDHQNTIMLLWIQGILQQAHDCGQMPRDEALPVLSKALMETFNGLLAYGLSASKDADKTRVVKTGLIIFFNGLQISASHKEIVT